MSISETIIKFVLDLALKWFRCETDIEVVRAEIHEMEADFHNLETNARQVMRRENGLKEKSHFDFTFRSSFVIFGVNLCFVNVC